MVSSSFTALAVNRRGDRCPEHEQLPHTCWHLGTRDEQSTCRIDLRRLEWLHWSSVGQTSKACCPEARDSPALSRVSMFTRVEQGAPLSFLQPVCYSQIHPRGVCHCHDAPKHTMGRGHLSISRNASAILNDGQGVTVPLRKAANKLSPHYIHANRHVQFITITCKALQGVCRVTATYRRHSPRSRGSV